MKACLAPLTSQTTRKKNNCTANTPTPPVHPSGSEAREPGHWGTWITKSGWIYEGPLVDNHFDKDCISGVYRLTTPGGEARQQQQQRMHISPPSRACYSAQCSLKQSICIFKVWMERLPFRV